MSQAIEQVREKIKLKGPRGFPLLGVLPRIISQDMLNLLIESQKEHGDVFRMKVGPSAIYIVAHPDHAQYVLQKNHLNYTKGKVWDPIRKWVLGNGLVASTGKYWLKQRRMIQPHFHHRQLGGLTTIMNSTIENLLKRWDSFPSEQLLDINEEMSQITMNVITRTMFGDDQLSEDEIRDVGNHVALLIKDVTLRLFLYFIPSWLPLWGDRRLKQVRKGIDEVVYRIIEQRRTDFHERSDLISMLMSAVDEETNEGMTIEELRDEVATIFLAGYETTSTTLTWTLHALSQYPEIEEKLEKELDEVLEGRVPTFEDLPKLTYTRKVLLEAMRMYPPVSLLPRTTVEDDYIDGYFIPKDSTLWVFIYGIHHHSDFWDNPELFDPTRFDEEKKQEQHRFAHIPFAKGPRQCVGDAFSLMEGTIALAMIKQKYSFDMVENPLMAPQLNTVLKPSHKLFGRVRKRN